MINGEPVFHTHECLEERKGKVMTAEELHDFAVQVLMKEYSDTNAEVGKYEKGAPNEADFYFVNSGKRPNFSVGVSGVKKVNVLVVCKDDTDIDISNIDTSWMVDEYHRTGAIPRVTIVNTWCIYDNDDSEDDETPICGGEFCFKYYSVSLLPDEENKPLDTKLSDIELAAKFCDAWSNLDASIIEPYLDKDFHYGSEWVFDELPSRAEYLDYLEAKLNDVIPTRDEMKIRIGRNHQTGEVAVLILYGNTLSALAITTRDGRITSGRMKKFSDRLKVINPEEELYMNHGDHLDCIMSADSIMDKHLQAILKDSKYWKTTRSFVTTSEMYEEYTKVFSLMYGLGDVKLLVTIAASTEDDTDEFMSIYPIGKGQPTEVKIDKVIEWDNQIEATVFCSIGEFEFAFFAIDYYCNKHKYKVGETISVDLSALGMHVEEAQRSFQFEGQQAIDWLAKIGEKPKYDENGNIEPVKFSMEKLVAFLNTNLKCPDEAEFQSPAGEIETTSILGIDFYKTTITVCRRYTDNGELEVSIPFYFRQDFFPTVQENDPIRGLLWVTGSVTGKHGEDESKSEEENKLAKIGDEFEEFMNQCDFEEFYDLMFILPKLPLLNIRDGYELDAFQKGDSLGWIIQPYCHKEGALEYYNPTKVDSYNDALIIRGQIDWNDAEGVPPILPYFNVPFTEEGIMQAWLLDNLANYMPKGWHSLRRKKYFVYDTERIVSIISDKDSKTQKTLGQSNLRDELMALDLEALQPSVKITGDKAVLEYAYWNNWNGLVKSVVEVEKVGNSVKFGNPKYHVLIEYDCGIKF